MNNYKISIIIIVAKSLIILLHCNLFDELELKKEEVLLDCFPRIDNWKQLVNFN